MTRAVDRSQWMMVVSTVAIAVSLAIRILVHQERRARCVMIHLPHWLYKLEQSLQGREFTSDEDMIQVAIDISAQNVISQSGGPFGCAIYERDTVTGKTTLCSVGANRVVPLCNSTVHAEMAAIQFAQKRLQTYSLRDVKNKEYILCTSCEPCVMCLGGTLWSGVSELICCAAKADAEAIGFNEGPVFEESYKQLELAGIRVKRQVMREKGQKILQDYGTSGVIY